MILSKSSFAIFFALIFSLVYASVLQSLPFEGLADRTSYLNYARNSQFLLLDSYSKGIISLIINEPIFRLLNVGLSLLFSPEGVVRAIVFIASFLFSFILLKSNPKYLFILAIFLITPWVLKNFTIHLRQGLGMTVFFLGYFSSGRFYRYTLIGLSPLVHVSFFFIIPLLVIPHLYRKIPFGSDVRFVILSIFPIFIIFALEIVAVTVGARQVNEYSDNTLHGSGLGFVFWCGIAGIFILQGATFLRQNQVAFGVLFLYVICYFFLEPVSRIFVSGLPIVLLAGLTLNKWRRPLFIFAYLSMGIIQWIMPSARPIPF